MTAQRPRPRAITLVPPARPRAASLDPRSFAPPIDLVSELSGSRESFVGGEWFTLSAFPAYMVTNLDRVKAAVPGGVGRNPTIACSLAHGISAFREHEEVRGLLDLKKRLDTLDGYSSDLVNTVAAWYRSYPVGTPNPALSGVSRLNVALPPEIKSDLSDLAGELGMYATSLAVLAVAFVLSLQPAAMREDRDRMARSVEAFLEMTLIRRWTGEAMIEALDRVEAERQRAKGR